MPQRKSSIGNVVTLKEGSTNKRVIFNFGVWDSDPGNDILSL